MCVKVIIDASAFGHVNVKSRRTAGYQLHQWIKRGDGHVVYTDEEEYHKELVKSSSVSDWLRDLRQRGQAEIVRKRVVQTDEARIPTKPIRRSNDPHVLALALASEATVLFSCDRKLQSDFSDVGVLPNIGRIRRRSVPLDVDVPDDMTGANIRRKFFERRACVSTC